MDEEVEVGEREKKRYTISGRREEETAGGAYRGREGEKRGRERGEGGDDGDVCYLEAGTEEKRKSASLLFCFVCGGEEEEVFFWGEVERRGLAMEGGEGGGEGGGGCII